LWPKKKKKKGKQVVKLKMRSIFTGFCLGCIIIVIINNGWEHNGVGPNHSWLHSISHASMHGCGVYV